MTAVLLTRDTLGSWMLRHLGGDEQAVLEALQAVDTLPEQIDAARRQVLLAEQWERAHRDEPLGPSRR